MSQLTELLARVDAERGVAMAARQTGASDAALDRVHALLQQSLLLEEQGDSATAGPLLDQAAWLVTDSFAMGSELGRDLLRYAQASRKRRGRRRPGPGTVPPTVAPRVVHTSGQSLLVEAPASSAVPSRGGSAVRWLWVAVGGALLAIVWPTLIWAATEFNLPALRMVASWSIAAVVVAVVTLVAGRVRDRRR